MVIFNNRQFTDEAKAYIKDYFLAKCKGGKKYYVTLDTGDDVLLTEETLAENKFELFYTIINGEWFKYGLVPANDKNIDEMLDRYLGTPK